MRSQARIIEGLLRLYPAAWRREYGAELAEVLASRPLTLRTCANVAWSALRQRARDAEPATRLGLAAMLFVATQILFSVRDTTTGAGVPPYILRGASMTFPPLIVWPFTTAYYGALLLACGCWTQLRRRRSLHACGVATAMACALGGAPVTVLGLLIAVGSDTPHAAALSPWFVVAAPLYRLPEAWLWGVIGGRIGRAFARRHPGQAMSSV